MSSLVGLKDVRGMLQVVSGQPEVVLWAIALEPYQVLWLGENIFYLELFLTFNQLRWGSLMRGSHILGVGVIGLHVLHILKQGEPG